MKADDQTFFDFVRVLRKRARPAAIDHASGLDTVAVGDVSAVLSQVLLDLAPPSLDAGAHSLWAAELLATHLRARNFRDAAVAFNADPTGALMRSVPRGWMACADTSSSASARSESICTAR